MNDKVKHFMNSTIEDVDRFTSIPMVIFFILFVAIIIVTWKYTKHHGDHVSNLPLDDGVQKSD